MPVLADVRGVVKTASGKPLAGVSVWAVSWNPTETGNDGRFTLAGDFTRFSWDPARVIHFSKAGYKPVTRFFDSESAHLDVTMEEGEHTLWIPRNCATSPSKVGYRMKFDVPKKVAIRRGKDVDYSTIAIAYASKKGREWMQIGSGANWSTGLPMKDRFTNAATWEERDLKCGPSIGVDIRGRGKDGKRWRFTGNAFETVTYDGISEEAAVFFDRIIESMCCH